MHFILVQTIPYAVFRAYSQTNTRTHTYIHTRPALRSYKHTHESAYMSSYIFSHSHKPALATYDDTIRAYILSSFILFHKAFPSPIIMLVFLAVVVFPLFLALLVFLALSLSHSFSSHVPLAHSWRVHHHSHIKAAQNSEPRDGVASVSRKMLLTHTRYSHIHRTTTKARHVRRRGAT